VTLVTVVFTGCAYVGDPKPPALDIPSRVTDLRAAQYGAKVLVEFTLPPLTTEGLGLTEVQSVELRAAAGGSVQNYSVPAKGPGPVMFDFGAQDWTGKQVTLLVRATGPRGKTSDWSNPVSLAVGIPLAAPAGFQATAVPQGVRLTWSGMAGHYRIFRGAGDATPVPLADSDKAEYLDATANFGYPYKYFVQAIEGELRQSEISEVTGITPLDTFAPAVPAGLSAVAGVGAVELAWERNTEDDFVGYHVYRSIEGGAFERIAGPIDAPTYSDRAVEAGKKYSYAVTAIDNAGNESERSAAAEVTAQ
jgi:hypothetical protein